MGADCATPQGQELGPARMATADGSHRDNGMTLVAVLLCTLMRGTKLQEAKVRCRISAPPARTCRFCGMPSRCRQSAPHALRVHCFLH